MPGARSMGHGHGCWLFRFYKYSPINIPPCVFYTTINLAVGKRLRVRPRNINKLPKKLQWISLPMYLDEIYLADFVTFLFYDVTHTFIVQYKNVQSSQWARVSAQGGAINGVWEVSVCPASAPILIRPTAVFLRSSAAEVLRRFANTYFLGLSRLTFAWKKVALLNIRRVL